MTETVRGNVASVSKTERIARAKALAAERRAKFSAVLYRAMPFADTASETLPWSRIVRLSMFQLSCGMALVLLNGTLNRVMIIELNIPAWLVAMMVALPMLFAPFRAFIGFHSDHFVSAIGWRRVPYLWMGSLLQFGGLAIMPFALLLLSGDGNAPMWLAKCAAALAFLLVGLGLHTSQTAGLALATDVAPDDKRPQVVALLYVVLLLGMLVSALVFGALLKNFTQIKLIQVVQGAAMLTMVFNCIALWKQESRHSNKQRVNQQQGEQVGEQKRPAFRIAWQRYLKAAKGSRFLFVVILGTAGFSMQDILLEPYGAQILNLSVSATTLLTAILAGGSIVAFLFAAWRLKQGAHPARVAATGILIGIMAFSMIIFAEPVQSPGLFRVGTLFIGFGAGLFAISTLIMAMTMVNKEHTGLSLGAWGAAQATAAGLGIALGGLLRDIVAGLSATGVLGDALNNAAVGYSVVYHLEIALLFLALVALGPLTSMISHSYTQPRQFDLAEFPN